MGVVVGPVIGKLTSVVDSIASEDLSTKCSIYQKIRRDKLNVKSNIYNV